VAKQLPGERVRLTDTLDGLEAQTEDNRCFVLKDYGKWKRIRNSWRGDHELPFYFEFEPITPHVGTTFSDCSVYCRRTLRAPSLSRPALKLQAFYRQRLSLPPRFM